MRSDTACLLSVLYILALFSRIRIILLYWSAVWYGVFLEAMPPALPPALPPLAICGPWLGGWPIGWPFMYTDVAHVRSLSHRQNFTR